MRGASAGRRVRVAAAALALAVTAAFWLRHFDANYHADFSAYWSAATVAVGGGDPYRQSPRSADGVEFPRSGFFYPPTSLVFLAPLAALPYHEARQVWMIVEIAMLAAVLYLAGLSAAGALGTAAALLAGCMYFFYPLYAHLERGQADLLTLFWIALTWWTWGRGQPVAAGLALAAAAAVKPPALLLLVVPALEREWRAVAGALAGIVLLAVLALPLAGLRVQREYLFQHLPALARTGDAGGRVDKRTFGIPRGESFLVWDGHRYGRSRGFAGSRGTVLRFAVPGRGGATVEAADRARAAAAGAVALTVCLLYLRARGHPPSVSVRRWRWITTMLTVLLWHPMTWIMNYVWLVLMGALVWTGLPAARRLRSRVPAWSIVVVIALFLFGIGDVLLVPPLLALYPKPPAWLVTTVISRVVIGGVLLWLTCLLRGPGRPGTGSEEAC